MFLFLLSGSVCTRCTWKNLVDDVSYYKHTYMQESEANCRVKRSKDEEEEEEEGALCANSAGLFAVAIRVVISNMSHSYE